MKKTLLSFAVLFLVSNVVHAQSVYVQQTVTNGWNDIPNAIQWQNWCGVLDITFPPGEASDVSSEAYILENPNTGNYSWWVGNLKTGYAATVWSACEASGDFIPGLLNRQGSYVPPSYQVATTGFEGSPAYLALSDSYSSGLTYVSPFLAGWSLASVNLNGPPGGQYDGEGVFCNGNGNAPTLEVDANELSPRYAFAAAIVWSTWAPKVQHYPLSNVGDCVTLMDPNEGLCFVDNPKGTWNITNNNNTITACLSSGTVDFVCRLNGTYDRYATCD